VRIGYFVLLNNPVATRSYVGAVGAAADACGFHSLWVGEHIVLFDAYDSRYPYSEDGGLALPRSAGLLEPMTTLAFLASCTQTIRLGTGIYILPQHNPVQAAKEISNVDWLCGGRLDLGVGIGWSEEEFTALAAPWPRRAARTLEYLEVMERLWRDEVASFEGDSYRLAPCRMDPKPVQRPRPPLYFGGNSEPALRRVATRGDGWLGLSLGPEEVARCVQRLEGMAGEAGRSFSELDIAVFPGLEPVGLDLVKRYRDAGATQVLASATGDTPDAIGAEIKRLAGDLLGRADAL